ncbi:SPRY domain-containing protein [Naegleria gruberi]|uniref:SPRY domain-containing protein n=1 Tax=Naegleria gruberi TaxID=5762 RepID=D2VD91_NAEGR|nr:SPRY domain-containing protein [Naegleria gruberi]EFC45192.1 SPRY domain-containing protein [Naegleria gruberi]|eukprot:XP_002677936.1 SPRY domain-containing protein [Naegleria gruberi strain NEG-M]
MASSTTPAKLIDPPPIDSLQYSAEKGLGLLFESLEKKKKPTTTLVSSKEETTAKVTATTQLPSLILDQSFYDPISPSSSSSSVIIAKNKIGYSSVFVDKLLEGNLIYRWNVKIINLNSWFSLGVANTSIVKDHRFSFTPFDEHGQFMFSANGYIWDRRIAGDTKHLVIKGGSYGVGDVITVELDTRIGQLTFLKNGIVVSSVKNVGLPVYPSFMMHGTESVEFMGVTETEAMDAVQTFEFVYPKHHYQCTNGVIQKLTSGSYASLFLRKSLGDAKDYGIYRWKIKVLTHANWIGVGAVDQEIAQECYYDLSPLISFGGYMYTINGYLWSCCYNGDSKNSNVGIKSSTGDVITLELNCSTREFTITKEEVNIASFKNVKLPLVPLVMCYGLDAVELLDFQQVTSFPSPNLPKLDNSYEFNCDSSMIEKNGSLIRKLSNNGEYSNVWLNDKCQTEDNIKRWRVKIDYLDQYNAIGVLMENQTNQLKFATNPYNQEGAYLLDHEGNTWNRFVEPKFTKDPKASYKIGDTIIVEMNCLNCELTFYKNNFANRVTRINHVKLPVYPFFMLFGNESLRILKYSDNILDVSNGTRLLGTIPSFKCDRSCIAINQNRISKTVAGFYSSIFIDTLLGTTNHCNSTFKWKIKVVKFTWVGIGVMRRDTADEGVYGTDANLNVGGYFLSGNGYVWDKQLKNMHNYKKEGAEFGAGDVLTLSLDCKSQLLQIFKNDKELASFENVRLPVYPLVMLYHPDCVEFEWL